MNDRPVRVIVVDDQPLARTGNALILDSADEIEVIGEAGSGEAALALVARDRPDVVLMDVRMPGMDGIEATRRITTAHPATRVIVLTTFDLDAYAFGALRAGASAFLIKSTKPDALVDAVKTVASGAAVTAPRLTVRLIEHFLGQPQLAGAKGGDRTPAPSMSHKAIDSLSPRERDTFAAMVRGLTNAEIGAELTLAPSTIKSHINSIFAKLGLRDRVHAVILGHEIGIARQQQE